jgi:hypothetical protein
MRGFRVRVTMRGCALGGGGGRVRVRVRMRDEGLSLSLSLSLSLRVGGKDEEHVLKRSARDTLMPLR